MGALSNTLPASGGASGPAGNATLQIHPSLKCNLSCAHCYSSSGPAASLTLDADIVCKTISDAAEMGYSVVSVSGGEPLMYAGLEKVLRHAKSLGLRTTVTTNGFFIDRARFARLAGLVDVLAISLDGPPEVHNHVRGNPMAFERLHSGLESVRTAGLAFGFIHTLTRSHWQQLPWVAQFAAEQGASLLQIHPLEMVGRAQTQLRGEIADDEILARVYIMAVAIASKYASAFQLQLDLIYREHLLDNPALFYAEDDGVNDALPSQRLGLLVLEADGSVVPLSYGFDHRYRVCDVRQQSLSEGWRTFQSDGLIALRQLCRKVWLELGGEYGPLLSNWYDAISARSHDAPRGIPLTTVD